MKIYQCIHKYPPHIPQFEKRWNIGEHSKFREIHDALLRDGYASVYRLIPPPNRVDDRVFFTIWNYERLQYAWALENGVKSRSLDEIRLAQIKKLGADVVYDHSPFVSKDFGEKLRKRFSGIAVAWNAFIKKPVPEFHVGYQGYVSLHRPFVEAWIREGFQATELQPSPDPAWSDLPAESWNKRDTDLMTYGQTGGIFRKRRDILTSVADRAISDEFNFSAFVGNSKQYYRPGGRLARHGVSLPFLIKWPKGNLKSHVKENVYGGNLYEEIRNSKAVLNTFTDRSASFVSNMRIFETIGNGAVLISEKGQYPDGLLENRDFFAFKDERDLGDIMQFISAEPKAARDFAIRAKERLHKNFGKEKQYEKFRSFVTTL